MPQIKYFHIFKPLEISYKTPAGYIFLPVHIFLDIKFYLRRKVQLVYEGNMTGYINEVTYYGVFNIYPVRIALFLLYINDLEVDYKYFGNGYLFILSKNKITIMVVTEFY